MVLPSPVGESVAANFITQALLTPLSPARKQGFCVCTLYYSPPLTYNFSLNKTPIFCYQALTKVISIRNRVKSIFII